MQSTLTHGTDDTQSYAAATKTAVPVAGVDTTKEYFVCLRNQDATNYVEVTTDDGVTYPCRMRPGECWGPNRMAPNIIVKVKANTAACDVNSVLCEAGDPAL